MRCRRLGREGRQQEGIKQLLRHDLERRAELLGNLRSRKPSSYVEFSGDATRKQQLSREQIHLDFAPLLAPIVDNPINTDR